MIAVHVCLSFKIITFTDDIYTNIYIIVFTLPEKHKQLLLLLLLLLSDDQTSSPKLDYSGPQSSNFLRTFCFLVNSSAFLALTSPPLEIHNRPRIVSDYTCTSQVNNNTL